jgi:hypothetical protein
MHSTDKDNSTVGLGTWVIIQLRNIWNECPHITNIAIYFRAITSTLSDKNHKLLFLNIMCKYKYLICLV